LGTVPISLNKYVTQVFVLPYMRLDYLPLEFPF